MAQNEISQPDQSRPSLVRTVRLRGRELLNNPALNKGTAFTLDERETFGLHGLLPPVVESLDDQSVRAYQAFSLKSNDLERHIYLRQLQDANEVLFYRLLLGHIEEMLPIVYTPVVALGCQEFSHIYRRPRGLFISYPLRRFIPALLIDLNVNTNVGFMIFGVALLFALRDPLGLGGQLTILAERLYQKLQAQRAS